MNRAEIIKAIFERKEEAISRGFDWPTNDSTEAVTTEALTEFLAEINEFIAEEE